MKASETLFEDDANLQRLTIELQDLTQEARAPARVPVCALSGV